MEKFNIGPVIGTGGNFSGVNLLEGVLVVVTMVIREFCNVEDASVRVGCLLVDCLGDGLHPDSELGVVKDVVRASLALSLSLSLLVLLAH